MTYQEALTVLDGKPKRGGYDGVPAFEFRCAACSSDGRDSKGDHGFCFEEGEWLKLRCVVGHKEEEILYHLDWTVDRLRIGDVAGGVQKRRSPAAPAPPKAPKKVTPVEDRPPPPPDGPTYVYLNPKGVPALEKKRGWEWYEERAADGPKPARASGWYRSFPQKAPGGGKLNERGQKLLYNLPAVIAAAAAGGTIYVNEGEKACDSYPQGAVATCQPNGAGTGSDGHWTEHHTAWLQGAGMVVIVADRDAPGKAYGRAVRASLDAAGVPCRVVHAKTVAEKDDAFDHFAAGWSLDDFVAMDEPTPDELAAEDGLTMWSASEVDIPPAEWIIDDYLLAGVLSLLDGKRGTTKTTLALQWAAKMSHGLHPFLYNGTDYQKTPLALPCGPIRTLYIHKGEDPSMKLDKVYRENGGVPGMISFLDDPMFKIDKAGLARIRGLIAKYGFRYIVIDNLIYFIQMMGKDPAKGEDAGPICLDLQRLASDTGVALHAMRHMRKGADGNSKQSMEEDISEAGLGSVLISSIARGQHVIRRSKDKPGVFILTCERGTIDTEPGLPIGWRKFGLSLEYLDKVDDPSDRTPAAEKLSQRSKARDVLGNLTNAFTTLTKDVERTILELGVSPSTMRRTMKDMRVVSAKQGGVPDGRFFCRIPDPYEDDDFNPWAP